MDKNLCALRTGVESGAELGISSTCEGNVDCSGALKVCAAFLGNTGNLREIRCLRGYVFAGFTQFTYGFTIGFAAGFANWWRHLRAAQRWWRPFKLFSCDLFLYIGRPFLRGRRWGQCAKMRIDLSGMIRSPVPTGVLVSHVGLRRQRGY